MSTFQEELAPLGLKPLWTVLHELVPPHPQSPARPAHWSYGEIRPQLLRAGAIISAAEAVRRVLILENPGMPGSSAITSTLYAGLQLILPQEVAPSHRHTQSAFRFVLEGEGAFTTVRGERFAMSPGDLILTPSLEWHDHGHEGRDPVIWLDALDIPLVRAFDAGFAENDATAQQPLHKVAGTNESLWVSGLRMPRDVPDRFPRVERFIYPHREWMGALKKLSVLTKPDPHSGFGLEFSNPIDGGTVLPTMSAFCQLIPGDFTTRPQCSSAGSVFCVFQGQGEVSVGLERFQLSPRDVWVVPSWQSFSIRAKSTLVLFSYSDRAAQERLGLWRVQKR